ncbi:hypothetical protein KBC86_04960 [Candidatus Gracilibacteria bacterium]|nr:hypothetical protein [Candidatus Gracilibacteria bacterium]
MQHFVGDEHLSPEHILSRHEDSAYHPPYYPHSWDDKKWGKVYIEHERGLKEIERALDMVRTRLVYVIQLATQVIGKKQADQATEQLKRKEREKGNRALLLANKSRDIHKILAVFIDYPYLLEGQSEAQLQIHISQARKMLGKGSNRLNHILNTFIELCEKALVQYSTK